MGSARIGPCFSAGPFSHPGICHVTAYWGESGSCRQLTQEPQPSQALPSIAAHTGREFTPAHCQGSLVGKLLSMMGRHRRDLSKGMTDLCFSTMVAVQTTFGREDGQAINEVSGNNSGESGILNEGCSRSSKKRCIGEVFQRQNRRT